MKDYDGLRAEVEAQGHIAVYPMGVLRDIEGAGKLGVHVRRKISDELRAHGLGHLPEELPIYQDQPVRVFARNTQVGRTIEAVLHPSGAGDQLLRSLDDREAQRKLEEIEGILAS